MKTLGIFVVGVLVGGVLGVVVAPRFSSRYMPYEYRTVKPIKLSASQGRQTMYLPEGTPVVSDVELVRAPEIGWWGFVPVLFNDMWEAQDLGVEPVTGELDIAASITVSGVRGDEAEVAGP